MRQAVYLFLVFVATLQVCWLGETWWWTVATMVVGAFALWPEGQRDEEGQSGDPADHTQGSQEPRQ